MNRPLNDYFLQEDALRRIEGAVDPDGVLPLLADKADLGGDGKVPLTQMHATLADLAALTTTAYGRSLLELASAVALINSANTVRACFRATKAADQGGIGDNTPTKIIYPTEAFDVGSLYDNATNYRWVPPAGPVLIGASALFTGTTAAGSFNFLSIYKNGASYKKHYSKVADTGTISVIAFDVANGTDYYEVFGNVDTTGGNWGVSSGGDFTNFFGCQI